MIFVLRFKGASQKDRNTDLIAASYLYRIHFFNAFKQLCSCCIMTCTLTKKKSATMIDSSLPLTDIHRHLDGNIRAQTILDLGREFNIALPATTLDTLRPHVQVTSLEPDLVSFLAKLDWG